MEAYNSLKRLAIVMAGIIVVLIAANILVDNGTIPSPRQTREAQQTQVALDVRSGEASQLGLAIGDQYQSDQWLLTIEQVEITPTLTLASTGEVQSTAGTWLVLHLQTENVTAEAQNIDLASVFVKDEQGLAYFPDALSMAYNADRGLATNGTPCEPGNSITMGAVFAIPPQSTGLHVGYKSSSGAGS
jgi:hypothetical protein